MPCQSPHLDTTPVVRKVWSLVISHNQSKCGASGNSQLAPAKTGVSVPASKRDYSQGGSSVASNIQGQNSIPASSLNDSLGANMTQCVTSTWSGTLQWSKNTPTATPVTSSHSTPAPGPTSTHHILSSWAFGIAITPTSFWRPWKPTYPHPLCRSLGNHYTYILKASYRKEWET